MQLIGTEQWNLWLKDNVNYMDGPPHHKPDGNAPAVLSSAEELFHTDVKETILQMNIIFQQLCRRTIA